MKKVVLMLGLFFLFLTSQVNANQFDGYYENISKDECKVYYQDGSTLDELDKLSDGDIFIKNNKVILEFPENIFISIKYNGKIEGNKIILKSSMTRFHGEIKNNKIILKYNEFKRTPYWLKKIIRKCRFEFVKNIDKKILDREEAIEIAMEKKKEIWKKEAEEKKIIEDKKKREKAKKIFEDERRKILAENLNNIKEEANNIVEGKRVFCDPGGVSWLKCPEGFYEISRDQYCSYYEDDIKNKNYEHLLTLCNTIIEDEINKINNEKKRIAEAKKKEEEERRIAEEKRKAKEAEERRIAEEKRKAQEEEEKRIAEAKKKEEKAKQAQEEELYVIGSGTGFFVNKDGYVVTNEHVAGICQSLASYINGKTHIFNILALDNRNDLALLRGEYRNKNFLNINPLGAEFGQDIMAFGFPLAENLSSSVKLTRGIVSSLSGPENDISLIQIDAAIQPGNSGGPVLNYNGQVVGVASSGLNKVQMLLDEESPYIPENVNFAVAATTLTGFLKSNSVKIFNESFDQKSSQELAKIGMPPTIQLHCLNTIAAHNQLRESENYNDVLLKKVVNLK